MAWGTNHGIMSPPVSALPLVRSRAPETRHTLPGQENYDAAKAVADGAQKQEATSQTSQTSQVCVFPLVRPLLKSDGLKGLPGAVSLGISLPTHFGIEFFT